MGLCEKGRGGGPGADVERVTLTRTQFKNIASDIPAGGWRQGIEGCVWSAFGISVLQFVALIWACKTIRHEAAHKPHTTEIVSCSLRARFAQALAACRLPRLRGLCCVGAATLSRHSRRRKWW